jgi:hypothetical protein
MNKDIIKNKQIIIEKGRASVQEVLKNIITFDYETNSYIEKDIKKILPMKQIALENYEEAGLNKSGEIIYNFNEGFTLLELKELVNYLENVVETKEIIVTEEVNETNENGDLVKSNVTLVKTVQFFKDINLAMLSKKDIILPETTHIEEVPLITTKGDNNE